MRQFWISAEGEPIFKDWRKKVIRRVTDKNIIYSILSSSFRIWLDLSNGLIIDNRALALFSFIAITSMCCFQFKFSSILMPRYLTDLKGRTFIGLSNFFLWCLKITNSVFFSHSMKFCCYLTNK